MPRGREHERARGAYPCLSEVWREQARLRDMGRKPDEKHQATEKLGDGWPGALSPEASTEQGRGPGCGRS